MSVFKYGRFTALAAATLVLLGGRGGNFGFAGSAETKASQYAPDNTGRNLRDVKGGPLTPENQSGNPEDQKLTQQVRQAIVKDDAISVNGKNIKIITVAGKVTLRGPVASNAERENIDAMAKQIAGVGNVDNQLEVIPTK